MSAEHVRIALTLPGGASLGTFEAGAVCALLVTAQHRNAEDRERNRDDRDTVAIDRITGTSAGALTAVLAARVLMTGEDPLPVFHRAWVESPSLSALRARGPWAPLTLRRARIVARAAIAREHAVRPERRQNASVTVELALACLRGLTYELKRTARDDRPKRPAMKNVSHLDWSEHLLQPVPDDGKAARAQREEWARAVDGAIASASHPLAFAPTLLDRDSQRARYTARGVRDLPEPLQLWYTDGGLLDNEPLGRALGSRLTYLNKRLVLLVRSDPRGAPRPEDKAWTGAVRPRWSETLARAVDLVVSHAAGENVRQAEKVNSRVTWTAAAAEGIAALIPPTAGNLDDLRKLLAELKESERGLRPDRSPPKTDDADRVAALTADPDDGDRVAALTADPVRSLVAEIMLRAAGLRDKSVLDIGVVTNDPDAPIPARDVRLQLGGFLDRRRRAYDFAAGYWRMLEWIRDEEDLGYILRERDLAAARRAAEGAMPRPRMSRRGARRAGRIRRRTRVLVGRLALRYARIAIGDAVAVRRTRRRDALERATADE